MNVKKKCRMSGCNVDLMSERVMKAKKKFVSMLCVTFLFFLVCMRGIPHNYTIQGKNVNTGNDNNNIDNDSNNNNDGRSVGVM